MDGWCDPGALPSARELLRQHHARLADSGAELANARPPAAFVADAGASRRGHGDSVMAPVEPPQQLGRARQPWQQAAAAALRTGSAGDMTEVLGAYLRARHGGQARDHSRQTRRRATTAAANPIAASNNARGRAGGSDTAASALTQQPQARQLADSLRQAMRLITHNLGAIDGLSWDLDANGSIDAQIQAIALMLTQLELRQPPPMPPWVLTLMDAGVLLGAALVRNRLDYLGHRRLTLHLCDAGFVGWLCGRWRWQPDGGWQHHAWRPQELTAGGVKPLDPRPPQDPHQRLSLLTQDALAPSLALQALLHSSPLAMAEHMQEFCLNVCASSRHLAALLDAGHLPAPAAILAADVEQITPCSPPLACAVAGSDSQSPFVLTSRLHIHPIVVRRPAAAAAARPATDPPGNPGRGETLASLCQGSPVSVLADMLTARSLARLRWFDLPAMRLAELHQSCPAQTLVYAVSGQHGQIFDGPALEARCSQQLAALLR